MSHAMHLCGPVRHVNKRSSRRSRRSRGKNKRSSDLLILNNDSRMASLVLRNKVKIHVQRPVQLDIQSITQQGSRHHEIASSYIRVAISR